MDTNPNQQWPANQEPTAAPPPQPTSPVEPSEQPIPPQESAPLATPQASITPEPAASLDHDSTEVNEPEQIAWQASEYVHHTKSPLWFVIFGVGVAIVLGLTIWWQNWTFAALIAVMAVAVVMYAIRQPRELHYALTHSVLTIENKAYQLHDFRSFGVVPDGGLFTVRLIPMKRFMPSITIYFAEDHGEDIVDFLGASLPMENMEPDRIDRLMRKLRF